MNYNSNSSASSDEFFDNMVKEFVEDSETTNLMENTINSVVVPLVSSTFQIREVNSTYKKRAFIPRDREEAHDRLVNDYFSSHPLYNHLMFRRRFRMHKHVFLRIAEILSANDPFFQQRRDATGRLGASTLQKCTAALRMLTYGTSADHVDEYLKLGASTARECLAHFVEGIITQFSSQYLRKPNTEDVERLLREGERQGFPGMMGSIDCMHWQWKNCPVAWKGMYQGRSKTATIILEAVASSDLWIWHAYFGTPGSCNDINVLQRSPVFDDILHGRAPQVSYLVNGNTYNMCYYLTDGIYPKWATFINAISLPQTAKHKLFTNYQESTRKDVERTFGVLQARFAIIRQPALAWNEDLLWKTMMACIIMHNMIVEDERDTYQNYQDPSEFLNDQTQNVASSSRGNITESFNVLHGRLGNLSLRDKMEAEKTIRDNNTHKKLKNDLVEHVWKHVHGCSSN